jgi:flagellar biosynthesis protein FliP
VKKIKLFKQLILLCILGLFIFSTSCYAQAFSLDLGEGGSFSTKFFQLLAIVSVLSLAPSLLIMVTSFTRIVVVLSFLRNALGLHQSPPNSILVSLALFLTAYIMSPVLEKSYQEGVVPYTQEKITEAQALDKIINPFKGFMLQNVREKDLKLFIDLSKAPPPESPEQTTLSTLVPAFMISELRRAFEIGFLLFIPFLIIDMVVASILMSMGMMMLPPITLSLPFKIIFFVLVDGWVLLAGSLVKSYGV